MYQPTSPGSTEPPKVHEMTVRIFGAFSSPSICNYRSLLHMSRTSSSRTVMNSFSGELKSESDSRHGPQSKEFVLTANVNTNYEHDETRRHLLSVVLNIFDSLGFLAPIVLQAEKILQSSYRVPSGWDDVLDDDVRGLWSKWRASVRALNTLPIPALLQTCSNSCT